MADPSPPWFFLAPLPAVGERVRLDGRESRHAVGARRLQPGDALRLFDGAGQVADARLEAIGSRDRSMDVDVLRVVTVAEPTPRRHVVSALPKADRQGVLISMLTQLGAASFTPLRTRHGVAKAGPRFAERARRIVVESCKQCRRAYLPEVRPVCTPDDLVAASASRSGELLIAHPGEGRLCDRFDTPTLAGREVTLVIGPEGGLTEEEAAALRGCGGQLVDLGDGILRIETAAAALLAAITMWAGNERD